MYTELNTLSAFSLLEGATLPEDLAAEAVRLGHTHLALTDRDGITGLVRFHTAARRLGLTPILGAELTLGAGSPLPEGARLVLLARTDEGYRNLTRLLTKSQLHTPKGEAALPPEVLADHVEGLVCLTSAPARGALHRALAGRSGADARAEARAVLRWLQDRFGEHLYAEIVRHGLPNETVREARLRAAAAEVGVPLVAAGDVHYATPDGRRLQDVLTCIRHHTRLDEAGRLLFPNGERHLRSPEEMARRFADVPEAVERSAAIAQDCTASLERLRYHFPDFPLPRGETDHGFLRAQVEQGLRRRYPQVTPGIRRQIEHELGVIQRMELEGYFLVVWDIVRFCREEGILCQGRGSAANSAVCYCLGISSVDPIGLDLLFERFLSEERKETPDIDLDIEHQRREEVIQYVYEKYGRHRAGMVCEVITYRGRSAVRDVGKALGFSLEQVDVLAKSLDRRPQELEAHFQSQGFDAGRGRVALLQDLVQQLHGLPRHLSIHVGGMIIAQGQLDEVVPIEKASMEGRTVVQWDKDDCGELGVIKIDLLGLGMLTLLRMALDFVRNHEGVDLDLASIPQDDPQVYRMLSDADSIGVFQVESRAQMATLPRMQPRCFYDLVVEVAIIRPGPIQGDMVHPYLRRRRGEEPVTYLHPSLEPVLKRTLGVPLFQEQGMKVAIAAAGFTAAQSDALRRAMGFRRATSEMEQLEAALSAGMTKNGIDAETQGRIIAQITAFASYGFPESHAASFALLVYASSWLKVHHPAPFYAAVLNAQPMGFYSPATLVGDASRHGVPVRPVDVSRSAFHCTLEPLEPGEGAPAEGLHTQAARHAVRLGLRYVHGIGEAHEAHLTAELAEGPFTSLYDFARRARLSRAILERIAGADGFGCFGLARREALWKIGALARDHGELFEHALTDEQAKATFPEMSEGERLAADHASTGLSTGRHPMALLRDTCRARRALTAAEVARVPGGRRVRVGGQVIVRQRPGSAKGMVFLTMEDETGMSNIAVQPHVYEQYRALVRDAPFIIVEGVVQRAYGVMTVTARKVEPLDRPRDLPPARSRDFH